MLRTIESSTSSTRLPESTSRSGVNFSRTLSAAVRAFDERAADVPVADQPFDRRDAQCEGHGVGGGLAGVRHRHDDRFARVERHPVQSLLLLREFLPEPARERYTLRSSSVLATLAK